MINPIVTIARRSARIVVQLQAVCFGRIGAVSFESRRSTSSACNKVMVPSSSVKTQSTMQPVAVVLQMDGYPTRVFSGARALDMDRTEVLEIVVGNKPFAELIKYIVEVSVSPQGKSAAGAVWQPLESVTTLRELWEQHASADASLHVRVRLPFAPATVAGAPPAHPSLYAFPVLGAEEHVSKVVAAIRGGHATQSPAGHLLLPGSLRWPAATNGTLVVRNLYAPLLEKVLNMCLPCQPGEDEATQRRIVTGQPDIGKSVWIWYVIYRILLEQPQRTIVLILHSGRRVFFIPPTGPLRVTKWTDALDLDLMTGLGQHPLVIADSVLPPAMRHPTLVVASTERLAKSDSADLKDYSLQHLHMPALTEEELWEMHAAAFRHLDKDGVERRLALWGPIPRHVLVKVTPEDQQALGASKQASLQHARGGDDLEVLVHERTAGQGAGTGSAAADPSHAAF